MRVVALRTGWIGKSRIREGQVFDWPEGTPTGSWVEPVEVFEQKRKAAEEAKPKRPRRGASLAELAEHVQPMPLGTGDRSVF